MWATPARVPLQGPDRPHRRVCRQTGADSHQLTTDPAPHLAALRTRRARSVDLVVQLRHELLVIGDHLLGGRMNPPGFSPPFSSLVVVLVVVFLDVVVER